MSKRAIVLTRYKISCDIGAIGVVDVGTGAAVFRIEKFANLNAFDQILRGFIEFVHQIAVFCYGFP